MPVDAEVAKLHHQLQTGSRELCGYDTYVHVRRISRYYVLLPLLIIAVGHDSRHDYYHHHRSGPIPSCTLQPLRR